MSGKTIKYVNRVRELVNSNKYEKEIIKMVMKEVTPNILVLRILEIMV